MNKLNNFLQEVATAKIKSDMGDRHVVFSSNGEVEDEKDEFQNWIDVSTDLDVGVFLKGKTSMAVLRWDREKRFLGHSPNGSGVELYVNRSEYPLFTEFFKETRTSDPLSIEAAPPQATAEKVTRTVLLSNKEINLENTMLFRLSSMDEVSSVEFAFDHSPDIKEVIFSDVEFEAASILNNLFKHEDAEVIAYKTNQTRVSSFSMTREFFFNNKNRLKKKTSVLNLPAALKEVCKERNTKTLVLTPQGNKS